MSQNGNVATIATADRFPTAQGEAHAQSVCEALLADSIKSLTKGQSVAITFLAADGKAIDMMFADRTAPVTTRKELRYYVAWFLSSERSDNAAASPLGILSTIPLFSITFHVISDDDPWVDETLAAIQGRKGFALPASVQPFGVVTLAN